MAGYKPFKMRGNPFKRNYSMDPTEDLSKEVNRPKSPAKSGDHTEWKTHDTHDGVRKHHHSQGGTMTTYDYDIPPKSPKRKKEADETSPAKQKSWKDMKEDVKAFPENLKEAVTEGGKEFWRDISGQNLRHDLKRLKEKRRKEADKTSPAKAKLTKGQYKDIAWKRNEMWAKAKGPGKRESLSETNPDYAGETTVIGAPKGYATSLHHPMYHEEFKGGRGLGKSGTSKAKMRKKIADETPVKDAHPHTHSRPRPEPGPRPEPRPRPRR